MLATVAANVVAVPMVLGFVALGGAVVATGAMLGIRHAFDGGRRGSEPRAYEPNKPPSARAAAAGARIRVH